MPFFYQGASGRNNDTINRPQKDAERRGYVGGGEHGINNNLTQDASPDWSPTGEGEAVVEGWKQGGTSAYDQDVDRARRMGAEGQQRQAVQLDRGQSDQSRGIQMGALGLMGQAAIGNAPSRAAALGRASTEDSIRQGGQVAAQGRGPGGALTAMNTAQGGTAQQMGRNNQAVADMRAQEMGVARGQYAQGTAAVRGQDITAATTQAQLEAQQRASNEQRQQDFERRGWGVRNSQQQAADDWARQQSGEADTRRRQALAEEARDDAVTDTLTNTALAATFGILSDERAKRNVVPMGSLSNLMHPSRK